MTNNAQRAWGVWLKGIVIGLRQVLSAQTISLILVMTKRVISSDVKVLQSVVTMMEHIPDHQTVPLTRAYVTQALVRRVSHKSLSVCSHARIPQSVRQPVMSVRRVTAYQAQMLRPSQVAVNQKSPVSVAMVLIA